MVIGGPASLIANLLAGESAAEWVLASALLVALLLSVIASVGSRTLRIDRERRARGLCPGCGYDIRATRTRCPECGRSLLA